MRFCALVAVSLTTASPLCSAFVLCSQLDPASPRYRDQLAQLAQESGLGTKFNRYDEQVVTSVCASRPEQIDELIDQRKVTAREATSIRNLLVPSSVSGIARSNAASSDSAVAEAKASAPRKPAAGEASSIDSAIDNLFAKWGQSWWSDRYVRGSSHTEDLVDRNGDLVVRGQFVFIRGGKQNAIPFAAEISQAGHAFGVTNLCYNDTTTGMPDCTASGESSAASRMMSAVIVGGIIAAMANPSPVTTKETTCHTQVSYGEPGMSGYVANADGVGHGGIPVELCN